MTTLCVSEDLYWKYAWSKAFPRDGLDGEAEAYKREARSRIRTDAILDVRK